MEQKEMEDIFDGAGWSDIYEKHQYKLWLTGMADELDERMLSAYLDAYSYEDADQLCFDEILYQLRIFRYIYDKNENFRLFPWN